MEKENEVTQKRKPKILRIIGAVVLGVILAVAFAFVFGIVVKLLWNWLMPAIFGLGKITYWQAFGIVVLAKLLFGGFGHHCDGHHNHSDKKRDQKWRRFFGLEDEHHGWAPCGSHKNWKYYKQFWEEEGKAAFEAYIKKIEEEK